MAKLTKLFKLIQGKAFCAFSTKTESENAFNGFQGDHANIK